MPTLHSIFLVQRLWVSRRANYQFMEASMIPVNCSLSCSKLSLARIGARSNTLFWGSMPSTSWLPSQLRPPPGVLGNEKRPTRSTSLDVYPTLLNPRGTPRRSKNFCISSRSVMPRSSSLMFCTSLARSLPIKTAIASRCRCGSEGQVKLKTAGAVNETATPCGINGIEGE